MPPEDRHSGTPGGGGGADVKSGVISAVSDDDNGTVFFGTPFSSTPQVTANLGTLIGGVVDLVLIYSVSTTQFQWKLSKGHGGSAHTWDIRWIATDAGDP